ncbi:MAG: hypothetical protein EOM62_21150, partial [Bacteroidia bacterium]|nr:hypothetical protein [Bacteroidia bacterium]
MELTSDTNYAELVIYIKPESLYSTYLNDILIPASTFDTFPYLGTRYYACQFGYYNENIPEIFHIRSENDFAAGLIEMGFNSIGNGQIALNYFHQTNSGVNYNDSYTPHTNINPVDSGTVYRCLGDTLFLSVTYNYDSVQIDWVVDGVYYANLEHLAVYLSDTETVEVEMIVQYNCPDTTHTFVHVLSPPEINLPSDTTICNGGTIAVSADHADAPAILGPGEPCADRSDERVYLCGPCSSALDVATHLAGQGSLDPWDSVLATRQWAGRGQMRRTWISQPGNLFAAWR